MSGGVQQLWDGGQDGVRMSPGSALAKHPEALCLSPHCVNGEWQSPPVG